MRPDAISQLQEGLTRRGLAVPEVYGIVGAREPASRFFTLMLQYFSHCGRLWTSGQVGCSLSHIEALENFLAGPAEYLLVIEDDIDLDGLDAASLSEAMRQSGAEYLNLCQQGADNARRLLGRPAADNPQRLRLAPCSLYLVWHTAAYVVSRAGAEKYLPGMRACFTYADDFERIFHNRPVAYWLHPIIPHQTASAESAIESERQRRRSARYKPARARLHQLLRHTRRQLDLLRAPITGFRPIGPAAALPATLRTDKTLP